MSLDTVTKQVNRSGTGILFSLKLAARKGILQPQEQGMEGIEADPSGVLSAGALHRSP